MKQLITVILLFTFTISFGQDLNGETLNNTKEYSENSSIEINYLKQDSLNNHNAAIFINNDFIKHGSSLLTTLNPNKIERVNVEKGQFNIEGIDYFGKILITLKADYTPNIITLNNLISKHLSLDNNTIILQIDGTYINQNFKEYCVDENYILKINASKVNTSKGNKIHLIQLVTKSAKNIENAQKPKQIIIRGTN